MATLSMQNNLSELDAMLSDLSRATNKAKSADSSMAYGDYSDYVDGGATASNASGPTAREGAPVR